MGSVKSRPLPPCPSPPTDHPSTSQHFYDTTTYDGNTSSVKQTSNYVPPTNASNGKGYMHYPYINVCILGHMKHGTSILHAVEPLYNRYQWDKCFM